ncbi:MAG: hypothetical protein ABDH16_04555 [Thermodesulfovibrionaceae bacterium]
MIKILTFLSVFFVFLGCARKLDPSVEDYLPPKAVERLSLIQQEEKIVVSWSYPEREKSNIKSFFVEKAYKDKTEAIGYFDSLTNICEDKDFFYGERYLYRVYVINKKGVYSAPKEAHIMPQKLQEIKDISYEITSDGVKLIWSGENYSGFNIYKFDDKVRKNKIATTTQQEVTILLNQSDFREEKGCLVFGVTAFLEKDSFYIESKAKLITIPFEAFIPSSPKKVHYGSNEEGVFLSWQEVTERWIRGYKIYRKTSSDYEFIGYTNIPLFFDKIINTKSTVIYYKISTLGPILESEAVEVKVEVTDG